jgi:two-component system, NtrC family, sensor kinase
VGLLAAGVAHEIGNPLGAVLGYIGMLEAGVENEAEGKDYLARAEQEVLRIHRIVRDLREYSKPSPRDVRALHVRETIRATVDLVSAQRDFQEIRFDVVAQEPLLPVRADDGQLQQVLVNLFLNAKDAMDRKGVIGVRVSRSRYLEPDDPEAGEPSCREGDPPGVDFRLLRKNNPARKWPFMQGQDLLLIDVTDTGSGISTEELPRVFDPFFTTKETGKGTGLGLSVSQRIIESFYGDMQIESTPDRGTTVRIFLPCVEREENGAIRKSEETNPDGTTRSDR